MIIKLKYNAFCIIVNDVGFCAGFLTALDKKVGI